LFVDDGTSGFLEESEHYVGLRRLCMRIMNKRFISTHSEQISVKSDTETKSFTGFNFVSLEYIAPPMNHKSDITGNVQSGKELLRCIKYRIN
jgi:hypothetical protein